MTRAGETLPSQSAIWMFCDLGDHVVIGQNITIFADQNTRALALPQSVKAPEAQLLLCLRVNGLGHH